MPVLQMPTNRITSRTDPRIAPYLNLKDRELAREGDRFIVEGEQVVRRLLASRFETESVLIADRHFEQMRSLIPEQVDLLVAPSDIVNSILGFRFHSGVMACGRRGTPPAIADIMATAGARATLAIVEDVNNSENLGSLIRIAAGFGVDAMILGERCADPFFRRSIRVSMGTVFYLPIVRAANLVEEMRSLQSRWGFELIATVLDPSAEVLAGADRPDRVALCFGSEAQGLSDSVMAACDRKITIPMHLGTDSLNVSVAAGIVLYHFVQYAAERLKRTDSRH